MGMTEKSFGVVGLGRMGGGLALQALEKGMGVVGYDAHKVPQDLLDRGLTGVTEPAGFRKELDPPRIILVYVPAGPAVDTVLDELETALEEGDIIVDGGNSYWGDSVRRHQRLRDRGIHFCDVGTSGGVDGARQGACFMSGGESGPIGEVEPILKALSVKGGYVHAGPPGSGHFVKLVHNGIEFGMLQAIGEGVDLLERFPEKLPVADVLRCWTNGSVIRSWLVELMEEGHRRHGSLDEVPPFVEDTGEVNWLIADALEMEAAIPVMSQAVMLLFASRDHRQEWARAIAVMRHGFGEHPYGQDPSIRRERKEGWVGGVRRIDPWDS